jgi:uncharacterized protein (UPF0332 family)
MTNEDREELKEQIQSIIKKAIRSIKAAKRLIGDEDYDFASSRLYYAVYYATTKIYLLTCFT